MTDGTEHVSWLLDQFKRNYPDRAAEWEEIVGRGRVLLAVDRLVRLYGEQNRRIHESCFLRNDGLTLAGREECWVRDGGPAEFFAELRDSDSVVFPDFPESEDELLVVWLAFESILLFTQHAQTLELSWHRLPTEAELVNDEWKRWAKRLRCRFAPLFKGVCETCREKDCGMPPVNEPASIPSRFREQTEVRTAPGS